MIVRVLLETSLVFLVLPLYVSPRVLLEGNKIKDIIRSVEGRKAVFLGGLVLFPRATDHVGMIAMGTPLAPLVIWDPMVWLSPS